MSKSKSTRAAFIAQWGELLFSAGDIEMIRGELEDNMRYRTGATASGEVESYSGQGPAFWIGERIRTALIAHDCNWTGSQLQTLAEVEEESSALPEREIYNPVEAVLIDALLCALRMQGPGVSIQDGQSLIWRFCYRLSQLPVLLADAEYSDSLRAAARGGPKNRGDTKEAKRLALQYLHENALDASKQIKPQKVIELEVWEMLYARRNEPGAFQIAGKPGAPTERAIKTIREWIGTRYKDMLVHMYAPAELVEQHLAAWHELALKVYARRNERPEK